MCQCISKQIITKNSQYFFSTFRDCLIANDDYNGYLDFSNRCSQETLGTKSHWKKVCVPYLTHQELCLVPFSTIYLVHALIWLKDQNMSIFLNLKLQLKIKNVTIKLIQSLK